MCDQCRKCIKNQFGLCFFFLFASFQCINESSHNNNTSLHRNNGCDMIILCFASIVIWCSISKANHISIKDSAFIVHWIKSSSFFSISSLGTNWACRFLNRSRKAAIFQSLFFHSLNNIYISMDWITMYIESTILKWTIVLKETLYSVRRGWRNIWCNYRVTSEERRCVGCEEATKQPIHMKKKDKIIFKRSSYIFLLEK